MEIGFESSGIFSIVFEVHPSSQGRVSLPFFSLVSTISSGIIPSNSFQRKECLDKSQCFRHVFN
jgi:hypothetical protein